MAGRGTDIMLGGNAEYKSLADLQKMGYSEEVAVEAAGFSNTQDEEVLAARAEYKKLYAKYSEEVKELAEKVREAGGLYIIGTERHESRRIDNQLRGRSGRQGDPGESTFFLSLEDDLMRIFGGERITAMMDTLKVDENTPIQSKMLTGVIESSQKKIEGRNFNIRKNVLNYDDVMNTQREIIYKQRQQVLDGEDLHENILGMIKEFVEDSVNMYITDEDVQDNWNLQGLKDRLMGIITVEDDFNYTPQELDEITKKDIVDLNATGDKAWFPTWQETLENVFVGGCSSICQEVYTQKLGQAYRVATGHGGTTEDGEAESRDYIESPYSKRSFIDYQDNIYSIKNSLYGTRHVTATTPVANSLMTIMKKYNYSGYNALNTALDEAIAALESAKKSGIAFVDDPANAQVKTCIDKINTLDDELNNAGAWFRALKVSK
jgi:preprotein translocase subunit SecA